jgi:DNA-binding transcriptional MerR regulator
MPLRTNGGQRRYAAEHVCIIKEIKMLKKEGLSLTKIRRKLEKGLISEAGDFRSRDGRTDGIDHLAERLAEVVRSEVLRFFQRGEG